MKVGGGTLKDGAAYAQVADVVKKEREAGPVALVLSAAQGVTDRLHAALNDRSRIVQAFSLQALADFAPQDRALAEALPGILDRCTRTGPPALRARARILLAAFRKRPGHQP